jgi:hypothetical protein
MRVFKVHVETRHQGLGWNFNDHTFNVVAADAEGAIKVAKRKANKPVRDEAKVGGKVYKCTAVKVVSVNEVCELS